MKIALSKLKHHPVSQEFYGVTEDEQLSDLIASMGTDGLHNPIVVNQRNEIISGNRRFAVAKKLGWKEIAVIKKKFKSKEEEVREIIGSNISREQTPSMKLRQIKRLYKIYGVGQGARADLKKNFPHDKAKRYNPVNARETVAAIMLISEGNIQKMLYIDERDPAMFKDIDSGKLSINKAEKMLKALEKESKRQPVYASGNNFRFMSEPIRIAIVWYPRGDERDYSYSDKIVAAFVQHYEENKQKRVGWKLGETFRAVINEFEAEVDKFEQRARSVIYPQIDRLEKEIRSGQFSHHRVVPEEDGSVRFRLENIERDAFFHELGVKDIAELKTSDFENLAMNTAMYLAMQNRWKKEKMKMGKPFLIALPSNVDLDFGDYSGRLIIYMLDGRAQEHYIESGDVEKGRMAAALEQLRGKYYERVRSEIRTVLGYYSPSSDQAK